MGTKKIASLLLAAIMIIGMSAPAYAASVTDFTDVSASAWYYDFVRIAAEKELINGTSTTTFSPSATMTRGQFVTVLGRCAGVDTSTAARTGKFTDVPADEYYAPYVYWATGKGIVTGTGDEAFSPNTDMTKEQMATMLYRYAVGEDMKLPLPEALLPPLGDASSVSDYAKVGVEYLYALGIISGNENGYFEPQKAISRAEATTLFVKFVQMHDGGEADADFIDCTTIYATILNDEGYATSRMSVGESKQIHVTYVPENTTIDKTCAYVSGDTSVITVNDTGLVTAVSVGTGYVTVTSSNGKTDVCSIEVRGTESKRTGFELAWGNEWSIGTYTGSDGVGYYSYEWTVRGETTTETREIGDNSGYLLLSPKILYSDGHSQIILPESYSAYQFSFTSSNPSLVSISADSSIIVHRAIRASEGPQTVTITVYSGYFETSEIVTITLYRQG